MKFLYPAKLEAAVSKDASRYSIQNVYLDVANRRAVATDGHILTVHPVVIEDGDTSGWLTREALEAYRKASRKHDYGLKCTPTALLVQNTSVSYPRPEYQPGSFPNYEAVMPARESVSAKPVVTLNFELLKRLVDSLGTDKDGTIAIFASDNLRAHIVKTTADGAIGIISPLRDREEAANWKLTLAELEAAPALEATAA